MTQTTDLAPIEAQVYLAPALSLAEFTKQLADLKDFCATNMSAGTDFGVIPGTNKPTLLKPGAEKMLRLFGLVVDIGILPHSKTDLASGILDYDFEGMVRSVKSGITLGNVHANCNSEEYRYWSARNPEPRKGRDGNTYTPRAQRLADQKNTILKMGDKRIWVAAALVYTMASELFTQDVEDSVPDADRSEPSQNNGSVKAIPCPKCLEAGRTGVLKFIKEGVREDGWSYRLWCCSLRKYSKEKGVHGECDYQRWTDPETTEASGAAEEEAPPTDEAPPPASADDGEQRTRLIVLIRRAAEERLVGQNAALVDQPELLTKKINLVVGEEIRRLVGSVKVLTDLTTAQMAQVLTNLGGDPMAGQ